MRRLKSRIHNTDKEFQENFDASNARMSTLAEALERVRAGGSPKAVERHRSRGKLFVRDRIDTLLDPG